MARYVSYDLNYRPSLWKSIGGLKRCQEVNQEIADFVDVMIGNEEDLTACPGFEVKGTDENLAHRWCVKSGSRRVCAALQTDR